MKTTPPILFMIFKRPNTTVRVFEAIRAARPAKLFIAADAPRPNVPGEIEKCAAVREIVRNVDWPCEVKTLFREQNLGCGKAVAGALEWFFSQVEEGIILEDDILPDPTFFPYCAALLERYRDNDRIMMISGYNPLAHRIGDGDYYASSTVQIWGWATWRRAIAKFDFRMERYPAFRAAGRIAESLREKRHQEHFIREFDMYAAGRCNNWDQQWMFSVLDQRGICLIACNNLVKNIGFGPDSTFAANSASYHAHRRTSPTPLPPKAPSSLEPNQKTDASILNKSIGLSRFHIFLTRLLAPVAPQIIKVLWWFSRRFHDRSNANS